MEMKVKATHGAVAVHSVSHSSAVFTLRYAFLPRFFVVTPVTGILDTLPFLFTQPFPVDLI